MPGGASRCMGAALQGVIYLIHKTSFLRRGSTDEREVGLAGPKIKLSQRVRASFIPFQPVRFRLCRALLSVLVCLLISCE